MSKSDVHNFVAENLGELKLSINDNTRVLNHNAAAEWKRAADRPILDGRMGGGLELLLCPTHPNLDLAYLYPIDQAVNLWIEVFGNIGNILGMGLVGLVVDLEMLAFEYLP